MSIIRDTLVCLKELAGKAEFSESCNAYLRYYRPNSIDRNGTNLWV